LGVTPPGLLRAGPHSAQVAFVACGAGTVRSCRRIESRKCSPPSSAMRSIPSGIRPRTSQLHLPSPMSITTARTLSREIHPSSRRPHSCRRHSCGLGRIRGDTRCRRHLDAKGLGASLVGAILLAVATSLPEISTTLEAVRGATLPPRLLQHLRYQPDRHRVSIRRRPPARGGGGLGGGR